MDERENAAGGRRGDTRARIQQVALELFAEQGYERTSLREVAERLGVTKAALYYHFKSKEDIVRSFTEDYFARMDALIAWGSPDTIARRLRDHLDAGADHVCVQIVGAAEPFPVARWREVAAAVGM